MTPKMFRGFDPTRYADEAKDRWGETEAYKESQRRTGDYGESDWAQIQAEHAAIYQAVASAMEAGQSADIEEVMDIAERHRLSIERWFYPCSHEMHWELADRYEADDRFAATIDAFGAGLTAFLAAAIRANAVRFT